MADESKKYGAEGGKARAENLTKAELSAIGQKGALARWEAVRVAYGEENRPLRIGNAEIACYVLEDGRRVLSQRGLQAALGFSRSGGKGGARRLAAFFRSLRGKGVDTKDLVARADLEVRFLPRRGGPAVGYEATILPVICDVIISAAEAGKLTASQAHIAIEADILRRGFAAVGIIALVDEATGFQKDRPAYALAEILDAFIAKELRPWVRRFPFEFYQEIFRLKQWDTTDLTPNSPKPAEVGKITVEVIYRRLGPSGIFRTLKKLTPRNEKGYLKNKYHSWLTADIGDPKLKGHIDTVVAVMKLSDNWPDFMQKLERAGIKRWTDNYELPLTSSTPPSSSEPDVQTAQ